jgi:NADPH2:quinone reductase
MEVPVKAVVVRHYGPTDALQVEDVAQPQPSQGELLVKVRAAGINPSDVKNVQGAMAGTTLPRIPGRDFAGVVVDGPAALKGREVWGTGGDIGFTRDGSHAEFILIPETAVLEKPEALSMETAGAAGLTLVTAWLALVEGAGIQSGESVLVQGAAGGVGSAAAQIARYLGANVIGAVRGREQADLVGRLGVENVIDTSVSPLADEARGRVDIVFDTTGHLFSESIEAAAPRGRVCVISAPPDGMVCFNLRSLYRKELRVSGADSRRLDVTGCAKLLAQMAPGLRDGRIRPLPPLGYRLQEAREAYSQAAQGKGRFCLLPKA